MFYSRKAATAELLRPPERVQVGRRTWGSIHKLITVVLDQNPMIVAGNLFVFLLR